jgi:MFS family permease
LLAHGRTDEAERIVADIERAAQAEGRVATEAAQGHVTFTRPHTPTLAEVWHVLLRRYRARSAVVLALMISQAFFYNAIFFTYALVLTRFHRVDEAQVGLYIVPFAIGNVLGPLLLGPLFDRIGRRVMIAATYALSGVALALTGWGFVAGVLDATTQTLAWSAVFFLASAAASSAYLTVSEVFPLEMRAMAISIFYAVGTGIGGFAAPALFGALIETGSRSNVFIGYAIGAALVIVAAAIAWRWAVNAERKPLEEVAPPLGSV